MKIISYSISIYLVMANPMVRVDNIEDVVSNLQNQISGKIYFILLLLLLYLYFIL